MPTIEAALSDPRFARLPEGEQTRVREYLRQRTVTHPAFQKLAAAEQTKVIDRIYPREAPIPGGQIAALPPIGQRVFARAGVPPKPFSKLISGTWGERLGAAVSPLTLPFAAGAEAIDIPLEAAGVQRPADPQRWTWGDVLMAGAGTRPLLRSILKRVDHAARVAAMESGQRALPAGRFQELRALPRGIDWRPVPPEARTRRMLPGGPKALTGRIGIPEAWTEPPVPRVSGEPPVRAEVGHPVGDWRGSVLAEAERLLSGAPARGSQREGVQRLLAAAARAVRGEIETSKKKGRLPWKTVTPEEPRKPVSLELPQPVWKLHPAEPTPVAPTPTPQTAIPAQGPVRPPAMDPTVLNLTDPKAIARYLVATGRVRVQPGLEGEFKAVPFYVKSRTGRNWDEVVEEIAQAKGLPQHEVEGQLFSALRGGPRERLIPTKDVELPPSEWGISKEEWRAMTPDKRRKYREFMEFGTEPVAPLEPAPSPLAQRAVDDAARELARKHFAQKIFAPPVVRGEAYLAEYERLRGAAREPTPRYKRTEIGDQALIPGTPAREVPKTPIRAERPQADIQETPLFGQERAAREAAMEEAQQTLPSGQPPIGNAVDQAVSRALGGAGLPSNAAELNVLRGRFGEDVIEAALERVATFRPARGTLGAGRWVPMGTPPAGLAWQNTKAPTPKILDRWETVDRRFVADQVAPDHWVVMDRLKGAKASERVPTFHAARQWVERHFKGLHGVVPPVPLPGPAEEEQETVKGRTQQVAQILGLGLPILAAILGGRLRPSAGVGRRPPPVPPQFRREVIRPPTVSPPRQPPRPPTPPTRGIAGGDPGPLPELPESAMGRAWRGVKPVLTSARALGRFYATPLLSRFEQMGGPGREISRRVQLAEGAKSTFYGQHIDPLVKELKRLTPAEQGNFVDAIEQGVRPLNDKVLTALAHYDRVMGPEGLIPKEAQARNLIVLTRQRDPVPFRPRQRFFPHEWDPEFVRNVIRPGSPQRARAVNHLLDTGQAHSVDEAELMLTEFFGGTRVTVEGRVFFLDPERFVGGLERAREINLPGYSRNPAQAVAVRGWKVARRFAELDHYGRLDAHIGAPGGIQLDLSKRGFNPAHGLIGEIQRQSYPEAVKAFQLWHQIIGQDLQGAAFAPVARAAMSWQAFTKLPLATIANATQAALVALRTNIGTAMQGLAKGFTRAGRREAEQLGVLTDMSLRQLYGEIAGRPAPGRLMDVALFAFNAVEKWDRIVGANAGRAWGNRLNRMLQAGPTGRREVWIRRELERLLFSPEEIQARLSGKRLLPGDSDRIAFAIADQTQYLARPVRRSEFFNTPLGLMMGQFKTFSINTGRLLRTTVLAEARRGNLAPLARLVAIFPIVGEAAADLRMLVGGRERPESLPERLLENFFFVGGLGLASDLLESLGRFGSGGGALSFLAGPGVSEAARISQNAFKTVKHALQTDEFRVERDLDWWLRYGIRQVPYAGPGLSEALRSDPQGEKRARMTWQDRLKFSQRARDWDRAEAVDQRARMTIREAHRRAAEGDFVRAQRMVDDFNRKYGTDLTLSKPAIQRLQGAREAFEAERRRRLSPGVRTLLPEAVGD